MESGIFEQIKEKDTYRLRLTYIAPSIKEARSIASQLNSDCLDSTFVALPLLYNERQAKVPRKSYDK
jgi:CRISPR/Cas system CMR-associated protein Cmr3 (group 5 of RAMP superfamily)